MKPPRILLFILSVLSLLLITSIFFPEDGIRLGNGLRLHFPGLQELFSEDTLQYADISDIINRSTAIGDSALFDGGMPEEAGAQGFDTVRANADSLKLQVHRLEYPGGDSTILYPVFRQLRALRSNGKLIRILHYGDSQIEGDRITSYIRNRLQQRFGGSGVGYRPAVELYGYQLSLRHTASDNWIRYTAFGNIDSTLMHNRYGMAATFARFTPYRSDSLPTDTATKEAWIDLKISERTYRLNRQFERFRLFYGYGEQPVYLECIVDGSLYDADLLFPRSDLNIKEWHFDTGPQEIMLRFQASESPDFYGISLDASHGVAVDNIAMRGSAGLVFTRMDRKLFTAFLDTLDVKMLILEFGGNVVPYIADNYNYYERWFYGQLRRLRQIDPDLSIVVIGVHDMSLKVKDRYESYPNLDGVRSALRKASFRAGCAYWDMYEAMGGHNSMPSWVFAEPSLATSDFTHFNARGARVIAEMFYNALMHDYEQYLTSIGKPKGQ